MRETERGLKFMIAKVNFMVEKYRLFYYRGYSDAKIEI